MTTLDTGTIPPITGPQSGPIGTAAATQAESGNILELIDEVDALDAEYFPFWRQRHALRPPASRDEGRIAENFVSLGGNATLTAADAGRYYQVVRGASAARLTLPVRSTVDDDWEVRADSNALSGLVLRAQGSDRIRAAGSNVAAIEVTSHTADWIVRITARNGGYEYVEVDRAGDMIPSGTMFDRIRGEFTHLKGWATYQDDALRDHAAIGRAEFDEMILLPTRNMVSEEIVNPSESTTWRTQGFAQVPSITIPVVDAGVDQVIFDEPGVHVSRAMTKMCLAYGGRSDLVCSPHLCGAIRTARSTDGARGVGFADLMLRRVVEQAFGFGIKPGDLLGIAGNFNPASVKVAWREHPHVTHHPTGTQMLEYKGTARVGARYTLAVISPVAFVRLIAG